MHLAASHRARDAALLGRMGGELRAVPLSRVSPLPLRRMAELHEALPTHEAALREGHLAMAGDCALVPLLEGGELVGVAVLEAPEDRLIDVHSAFTLALAKAIVSWRATRAAAGAPLGESVPLAAHQRRRQEMLELLNRNEWNITRVAHIMGTTRRTVYMRMERYEIRRERVPRTLKPRFAGVE